MSNSLPSNERVAGALSYVFFLIPVFLEAKTEFTVFHMKQSLFLLVSVIIGSSLPFIGGAIASVWLFATGFLAWQAYLGERFDLPYVYPYIEKAVVKLNLTSFFTPHK